MLKLGKRLRYGRASSLGLPAPFELFRSTTPARAEELFADVAVNLCDLIITRDNMPEGGVRNKINLLDT